MPPAFAGVKKCNCCKVVLPMRNFCKNRRKFDGLGPTCRYCCSVSQKRCYRGRRKAYNEKRRIDLAKVRELEAKIIELQNELAACKIPPVG